MPKGFPSSLDLLAKGGRNIVGLRSRSENPVEIYFLFSAEQAHDPYIRTVHMCVCSRYR